MHKSLYHINDVFQAIGNRLEDMLNEDRKHIDTVVNLVNDPDGQRELLQQDEEEDFLDEGINFDELTCGVLHVLLGRRLQRYSHKTNVHIYTYHTQTFTRKRGINM